MTHVMCQRETLLCISDNSKLQKMFVTPGIIKKKHSKGACIKFLLCIITIAFMTLHRNKHTSDDYYFYYEHNYVTEIASKNNRKMMENHRIITSSLRDDYLHLRLKKEIKWSIIEIPSMVHYK